MALVTSLAWVVSAQAMLPAPVGRVWRFPPCTNGIGTTSQPNLLPTAARTVGRLPRTPKNIAACPESNSVLHWAEAERYVAYGTASPFWVGVISICHAFSDAGEERFAVLSDREVGPHAFMSGL